MNELDALYRELILDHSKHPQHFGLDDAAPGPGAIAVHLAANWAAPFGIALVADRLSALMLVLVGIVSLASALYATAGWSRAGRRCGTTR